MDTTVEKPPRQRKRGRWKKKGGKQNDELLVTLQKKQVQEKVAEVVFNSERMEHLTSCSICRELPKRVRDCPVKLLDLIADILFKHNLRVNFTHLMEEFYCIFNYSRAKQGVQLMNFDDKKLMAMMVCKLLGYQSVISHLNASLRQYGDQYELVHHIYSRELFS